jgi:general secretion pathway protein J
MLHNFIKTKGFTLLEILIALFIFSIISLLLSQSLRTVINAQAGTEKSAERLRGLQLVFLVMSRDIEQTVDRPIMNTSGREEAAFIGTPQTFTFTHAGYASSPLTSTHSDLQRTSYAWHDNSLWRTTWPNLDQAPDTKAHTKRLLENVSGFTIEYLDAAKKFHSNWPAENANAQVLPRAIKVTLTFSQWGTISQLYIISAQQSTNAPKSSQSS